MNIWRCERKYHGTVAIVTYLPRHLADRLALYLAQFPIVLLHGARQVGKSTFLEHALPNWRRVDLEDATMQSLVDDDPALFIRDHPERVWFDEAQRSPNLFPALRVAVDRDRRPGRFVLSGSASPHLVKSVSESLAGRAGVLRLDGLDLAETLGRPPSRFLTTLFEARSPRALVAEPASGDEAPEALVVRRWQRGGFPEPFLTNDGAARGRWFGAYLRLLAERDLVALHGELRPAKVYRLLRMLATRHAQTLSLSSLARDHGASTRTIGALLDILEGAFLWRRLEPLHHNLGKRLVRAPKGYIVDSGLLHALLAIHGHDDLLVSPMLGPSWEGFVVEQLLAAASRLDPSPTPYFWATHQGAEVDLVFELGHRLYPIAVKHTTRVGPMQRRGLRSFLSDHAEAAAFGVLVYRGEHRVRLEERIVAVPATALL